MPMYSVSRTSRTRTTIERMLASAGGTLREQAEAACAQHPTWAVLVSDVSRIDLLRAPLDVVLRVVDLEPGQSVAVALPIEVLSHALGPSSAGLELARQIRETPPNDCCVCVVATRRELLPTHLSRDGSLPRILIESDE